MGMTAGVVIISGNPVSSGEGGTMRKKASDNLEPLNRGGVLIRTSSGSVQFGIPPETIKDTMKLSGNVPEIYIVPNYMFSIEEGISLAELEFPIYYNFFIRQRKTRVICTENQARRLTVVLKEALTGPDTFAYLDDEFVQGRHSPEVPDLKAEGDYFRTMPINGTLRKMKLDDVVEFLFFDDTGRVGFDAVEIRRDSKFNVEIHDSGKKSAVIKRDLQIVPGKNRAETGTTVFRPPLFGVTTIGAGHGFDPESSTSGIIIWINRRGVVVDPPVNSTDKLLQLGVNPKWIDSVILTHCHADHDAGTLQAIMQEGKLNLYTTKTIFESFIKKSEALTGVDRMHLRKMIHFSPVILGVPLNIMGGNFFFNYTLHSIPTISIRVNFRGKGMVYSSDTLNDPDCIGKMYEQGVISKERYKFLRSFSWEEDLIFHDAGVPPLHTPIQYLCTLPESVRRKLYLVHVSHDSIPKECGLKIAPIGLSNTVELNVPPSDFDEILELLSVIMNIDIFKDFTISKIREFLSIVSRETFKAHEFIFKKGDRGGKFYIIISGTVDIIDDGKVISTYSDSDYFGEKSIVLNKKRSASIQARNEVRLLSITGDQFWGFIRGTAIEKRILRLAVFQDTQLRNFLDLNTVFKGLTPTQKIQLHKMVEPVAETLTPGTVIIKEDMQIDCCYFIEQGSVNVFRKNIFFDTLERGQMFGVGSVYSESAFSHFTIIVKEDIVLHKIRRSEFRNYIENNPGVYMKFYYYDY